MKPALRQQNFPQPDDKGAGGGETVIRGLSQHLEQGRLRRLGQIGAQGTRRHQLAPLRLGRSREIAGKRRPPGEHTVDHGPQSVPVGGRADLGGPLWVNLLWGQVLGRERGAAFHRLRQPETHQGHPHPLLRFFYHHIARPEIEMEQVLGVRPIQHLGHLDQDGRRPFKQQCALFLQ